MSNKNIYASSLAFCLYQCNPNFTARAFS